MNVRSRLFYAITILICLLIRSERVAITPTFLEMDVFIDQDDRNQACTSFCLENGDHCLFGTNQDNLISEGLLYLNKRHVSKTGWDASTTGKYAQWVSKYGSVVFAHVGYQLPWAGMNEAGLMISTMALGKTENPTPDERSPLDSTFWVQYQLDNHSTVEEVLASSADVRIANSVDHYLVCDRTGVCATIEFLKGEMVVHSKEDLPVKALTNSAYQDAVSDWQEGRIRSGFIVHDLEPDGPLAQAGIQIDDIIVSIDGTSLNTVYSLEAFVRQLLSDHKPGDKLTFSIFSEKIQREIEFEVELSSRITKDGKETASLGMIGLSSTNSLERFAAASNKLQEFDSSDSEDAVDYAFDMLAAVSQANTAWSIVFDPINLQVHWKTSGNPQHRFIDLHDMDFSCLNPVLMLDVHEDGSGDVSKKLSTYSHEESLEHTLNFVDQYEGLNLQPLVVNALLNGLESFQCVTENAEMVKDSGQLLEGQQPLISPHTRWIGMMIVRRFWPIWVLLTLLSLAFFAYRLVKYPVVPLNKRVSWTLLMVVTGPIGLLIFLLTQRKRNL